MRKWVVIKDWRDSGPTTSPDYRWWVGCVEDRTAVDEGRESDEHEVIVRERIRAAGLTLIDVFEEPCCDHEDKDEFHIFGECSHVFLGAHVRVPARSQREAYELTCAALDLQPSAL